MVVIIYIQNSISMSNLESIVVENNMSTVLLDVIRLMNYYVMYTLNQYYNTIHQ